MAECCLLGPRSSRTCFRVSFNIDKKTGASGRNFSNCLKNSSLSQSSLSIISSISLVSLTFIRIKIRHHLDYDENHLLVDLN